MAWYTYQILADYLNRVEDHAAVEAALDSILADNVVLTYGTQTFQGKSSVMQFLEETSRAISFEFGFRATPVIICDIEDPEYSFTADNRYTAITLLSKLEEYVSWYFLLRVNKDFLIDKIYGTRGIGYSFYPDVYTEGSFDYSEYAQ